MAAARLKTKPAAGPKRALRAKAPTLEDDRRRMGEVLRILKHEYPEAHCSLTFETSFQLLSATILSAQCTDERVNQVTPALFARFPHAEAMAEAPLAEVEELIRTTGFFRNKAKSLTEMAKALVAQHGGDVPRRLDELTALRGVGRKTANVILGNAFDTPGLVVDTHVGRISRRLGFTRHADPVKVETEMMERVPRDDWTLFAHLLIDHGRKICTARRAYCEDCRLSAYCAKIGVGAIADRVAKRL